MMDINRLIMMVLDHIMGALRYRWFAIAIAWTICLGGWWFVLNMPPVYGASARVFVDTDSLLRPLLKGLYIETDVGSDLSVMSQVLMSRPQIERVVREADLDLSAKTSSDLERLLLSVEKRIKLASTKNNIYTISFNDTNRDVALKVVDALLETLVEETLGSEQVDSEQAEKALLDQINKYEARLVSSENRLKEFKRQNVGLMPGDRGDYYDQLQSSLESVAQSETEVRILDRRRAALAAQIDGEEPVFGIMTSSGGTRSSATPVDGQIRELEAAKSQLLVQFTENHPEVAGLNRRLKELKEQRETLLTSTPDILPSDPESLELNPVYQNMRIQLATTNADLAAAQGRLAARRSEVERLQKLVDTVPEVEAQLNQLNRDYGVVQSRYEDMLARWETLQTGKLVQSGADNVKFRVIEPPFAPASSEGPNRPPLLAIVMVFALGAGAGLAWLISLVRPVIVSASQLMQTLDLEMLGTISVVSNDSATLRTWGWSVFATASILATGALVIITADSTAVFVQSLI